MSRVLYVPNVDELWHDDEMKLTFDTAIAGAQSNETFLFAWKEIIDERIPNLAYSKEFSDLHLIHFAEATQFEMKNELYQEPARRVRLREAVVQYLRMAYTYFSHPDLRLELKKKLWEVLELEKPNILITHGLGAVLAYEVLTELPTRVPTFITLGAPLGWAFILAELQQHLKIEDLVKPSMAERWFNIVCPSDFLTKHICLLYRILLKAVLHLQHLFDRYFQVFQPREILHLRNADK